jgi:hypothetical protein
MQKKITKFEINPQRHYLILSTQSTLKTVKYLKTDSSDLSKLVLLDTHVAQQPG